MSVELGSTSLHPTQEEEVRMREGNGAFGRSVRELPGAGGRPPLSFVRSRIERASDFERTLPKPASWFVEASPQLEKMERVLKKLDRPKLAFLHKLFGRKSEGSSKLLEDAHYAEFRTKFGRVEAISKKLEQEAVEKKVSLLAMPEEMKDLGTAARETLQSIQEFMQSSSKGKVLEKKFKPFLSQLETLHSVCNNVRTYHVQANVGVKSYGAIKRSDFLTHYLDYTDKRIEDFSRRDRKKLGFFHVLRQNISREKELIRRISQDPMLPKLASTAQWKDAVALKRSGISLGAQVRAADDLRLDPSPQRAHALGMGSSNRLRFVCRSQEGAVAGVFTPQDGIRTGSRLMAVQEYAHLLGLKNICAESFMIQVDGKEGTLTRIPPGEPLKNRGWKRIALASVPSQMKELRTVMGRVAEDPEMVSDPVCKNALTRAGVRFEDGKWWKSVEKLRPLPTSIQAPGLPGKQAEKLLRDSVDMQWWSALSGAPICSASDVVASFPEEGVAQLVRVDGNALSMPNTSWGPKNDRLLPGLANADFAERFGSMSWETAKEKLFGWLDKGQLKTAQERFHKMQEHLQELQSEGCVAKDWKTWTHPVSGKNADSFLTARADGNLWRALRVG